MQSQRFQPLNLVHKNLRTLLYETMLLLHITDFTKPEAKAAKKRVEEVLDAFAYQIALEEAFLFSSIHDYEPLVIVVLRDDQRERTKQIRNMQQLIKTYTTASEEYLCILFAGRFIHRFNDFMMMYMEQMRSHELMITPVLWRYYSDDELKLIASSLEGPHLLNINKVASAA